MVTLPMTFLSNTPLDCTIHHSLWPSNFTSKATKIPSHTRFVQSYAKKYCSEAYISPFLLYLPFTLLLAPMVLTACEKIFIGSVTWAAYLLNNIFTFRIFKTEKRLEQFYSLLIKESLDREDVNSLEKENVRWLHRHQSVLAGNAKIWYFLVIYTRSDKLSGIAARATSPTYTGNSKIALLPHPQDCIVFTKKRIMAKIMIVSKIKQTQQLDFSLNLPCIYSDLEVYNASY